MTKRQPDANRRLEEDYLKITNVNPSTIEQAKLIVKSEVIEFLSDREIYTMRMYRWDCI